MTLTPVNVPSEPAKVGKPRTAHKSALLMQDTAIPDMSDYRKALKELVVFLPGFRMVTEDTMTLLNRERYIASFEGAAGRLLRFFVVDGRLSGPVLTVQGFGAAVTDEGMRMSITDAKMLLLNADKRTVGEAMDDMNQEYEAAWCKQDHVHGAMLGVADVCNPLLHRGVSTNRLSIQDDDPFGLTEMIVSRYFGYPDFESLADSSVWCSDAPGKHFVVDGTRYDAKDIVNMALETGKQDAAQHILGRRSAWGHIPILEPIAKLPQNGSKLTREELGSLIYAALLRWSAAGFEGAALVAEEKAS